MLSPGTKAVLLTAKEYAAVQMLHATLGAPLKEIQDSLGLTKSQLAAILHRAYVKLGVRSAAGACILFERGVVVMGHRSLADVAQPRHGAVSGTAPNHYEVRETELESRAKARVEATEPLDLGRMSPGGSDVERVSRLAAGRTADGERHLYSGVTAGETAPVLNSAPARRADATARLPAPVASTGAVSPAGRAGAFSQERA